MAHLVCQTALFAALAVSPLVAGARAALVSSLGGWPLGPTAAGTLAAAGLALMLGGLSELVGLTTGFYRTHLLDRRYGLTAESAGAWAAGHLKASIVRLGTWMLGAMLIYAAMSAWPRVWWAIAAGAFAAASVVVMNLAPVLLLPAFYAMAPLTREPLRTRLAALVRRAGARRMGMYEWTLGDRTCRANAALVGVGPTRRILLSDTLLAAYSIEEIEVVVAHELAHHVHRDAWKTIASEAVVAAAGLLFADRLLARLASDAALASVADPAGLPVLVLAVGTVALALAPAANALSRRFERRADRYALQATANPRAFISTLRRLAAHNLAEEHPSRLVEWLCATHPSPADRMAAAKGYMSRSFEFRVSSFES